LLGAAARERLERGKGGPSTRLAQANPLPPLRGAKVRRRRSPTFFFLVRATRSGPRRPTKPAPFDQKKGGPAPHTHRALSKLLPAPRALALYERRGKHHGQTLGLPQQAGRGAFFSRRVSSLWDQTHFFFFLTTVPEIVAAAPVVAHDRRVCVGRSSATSSTGGTRAPSSSPPPVVAARARPSSHAPPAPSSRPPRSLQEVPQVSIAPALSWEASQIGCSPRARV
jgi:hypothetical protein